jgi:hypothetical protein
MYPTRDALQLSTFFCRQLGAFGIAAQSHSAAASQTVAEKASQNPSGVSAPAPPEPPLPLPLEVALELLASSSDEQPLALAASAPKRTHVVERPTNHEKPTPICIEDVRERMAAP